MQDLWISHVRGQIAEVEKLCSPHVGFDEGGARRAGMLVQAGSIRGAAGVRSCPAHLDRRRMESSGRRTAVDPFQMGHLRENRPVRRNKPNGLGSVEG
jgi:hypothetical protein